MAERFIKRYELELLKIQSSDVDRSIQTAEIFAQLYNHTKDILIVPRILDADLRPGESCSLYSKRIKSNASEIFKDINYPTTSSKLYSKYHIQFSSRHVHALLELCAFEITVGIDSSVICSIFDDEDILYYELASDMKTFYDLGYGDPFNSQIMCSLMKSMMNDLNRNGVTLRFTHAETLIPFSTLLNLFKDKDLNPNESIDKLRARIWRSSLISPMSGNIIMETFSCPEFRIKWRLNEDYIDVSTLKILNQCSFDEFCNNTLGTIGGWNN
jgi:multiple inositol-polyphosphate phosphatase/2,3-bisphosphoglycerate 3-phosphatase